MATSGLASSCEVDRERQGLGAADDVAGEGDGGAELAEGPGPREHGSGDHRRQDHRQGDPSERGPPPGPQGGRHVLVATVHRAQRGLDRDDEERERHERLGQDGAGGRERELHPEAEQGIEPVVHQAPVAEGGEQGDAADDRGQHQRQQHQAADERLAREVDPGQHPGQGQAEQHRQRGRAERADQRQAERVPCHGRGRGRPRAWTTTPAGAGRPAAARRTRPRPRRRRRPGSAVAVAPGSSVRARAAGARGTGAGGPRFGSAGVTPPAGSRPPSARPGPRGRARTP